MGHSAQTGNELFSVISALKGKTLSSLLLPFAFVLPRTWSPFAYRSLEAFTPDGFEIFYSSQVLIGVFVAVVIMKNLNTIRVALSKLAFSKILILLFGVTPFLSFILIPALPQLAPVLAFIEGLCRIWLYLLCVLLLSKLSNVQVLLYSFASYSIATIIVTLLSMLPIVASSLVVSPLPLCCVMACQKGLSTYGGNRAVNKEVFPSNYSKLLRVLVPYIIMLFVVSFILGYLHNVIKLSTLSPQLLVCSVLYKTIAPLVLAVFFVRNASVLNIGHVFLIIMLFVLTFLVINNLYEGDSLIVEAASDYTRWTVEMLLFVLLIVFSRSAKVHPLIFFGFGWSLSQASMAFGMFIHSLIQYIVSPSTVILYLIFSLVTVTVLVFLLNIKNFINMTLLKNESQLQSKLEKPILEMCKSIEPQCRILSEEHNLTSREKDILPFLCVGLSKATIAEHFFISENTVRTHAKNLYRKLGINSRKGLIDLLSERSEVLPVLRIIEDD